MPYSYPIGGTRNMADESLPIFRVEKVQLQFSIASDFVAAQVADNVLVLALSTGRLLRIDLDNPGDIDGGVLSPSALNLQSAVATWTLIVRC